MVKKRSVLFFAVFFAIFSVCLASMSLSVSAKILNGTILLKDISGNSSQKFHFNLTPAIRAGGNFYMDNITNYNVRIVAVNANTSMLNLHFFSPDRNGQQFNTSFFKVPKTTYLDFMGFNNSYGNEFVSTLSKGGPLRGAWIFPGDVVAFKIINASGTYYGAIYVNNFKMNPSNNFTFTYKFNTVRNNNNLTGTLTGCAVHSNFTACVQDFTNSCFWNAQTCIASQTGGFGDMQGEFQAPPADCEMLPKLACKSINRSVCYWDTTANSGKGECNFNISFNSHSGFNCTNILNKTFCRAQPFTEKTGLCRWNATNKCVTEKNKTHMSMPTPPVFNCEAAVALRNQTYCNMLANLTYNMPCGWDSTKSECKNQFFDFDKFDDFEDIGSESSCLSAGGSWKEETTFNPITDSVTSETWCEFGVAVKSFNHGSGGGFGGFSGGSQSCDTACFACEFQGNNSKWTSSATAQSACTGSKNGCKFRADANSFNGYGWCDPASGGFGGGGGSCDKKCGDCSFLPVDAKDACQKSAASCRWDNTTQFCIGKSQKSCTDSCLECSDQNGCTKSQANGGCSWSAQSNQCTPVSGAYEICFDNIDNDNNGDTDCADFKCGTDEFCGGGNVGKGCYQYDVFKYGTGAQGNCTAGGCAWIRGEFGGNFCGEKFELCFMNKSLTTAGLCNGFGDGKTCIFENEPRCDMNKSKAQECFATLGTRTPLGTSPKNNATNKALCNAQPGCFFQNMSIGSFGGTFMGGVFCDFKPFAVCNNQSVQSSKAACQAEGCIWQGDKFSSGFEGGFVQNCQTPWFNYSIRNATTCKATGKNGTGRFPTGIAVWQGGMCEPAEFFGGGNFIGGTGTCVDNDGDVSSCLADSRCFWEAGTGGTFQFTEALRNPNGSRNGNDYLFTSEQWMGIGLQQPRGVNNVSDYMLNKTDNSRVRIVMSMKNAGALAGIANVADNTSTLYCNSTVVVSFNWTDKKCLSGTCARYNNMTCSGKKLHYFANNKTGVIEALWEVDVKNLKLDALKGDKEVTDVTNVSTVIVNGNLSEHIAERNSSSRDKKTNATRVRTSPGICDPVQANEFFKGMDESPPLILAGDIINTATEPGQDFMDIMGLGVKKSDEAYMYGISTVDMAGSAICKGVPLGPGEGVGSGRNTSRYYLYLDTDGKSTGGCKPYDNTNITGFEYYFRYSANLTTDGKLSESLTMKKCTNTSVWAASNIPFKSSKDKGCDFVNGPIFAIDKDTLIENRNVNVSKGWRAYATSANKTGNASKVSDRVGPGTGDFKGVDAKIVDCTETANKDDSSCTKFQQFGFFPGEFGPACKDLKDNDGDGDTDCNDKDCAYDPFFCSGSFGAITGDDSSPSFAWNKVNAKLPTSLSFIFDTNEPSNGTLRFYNDSSCKVLNKTVKDAGLTDNNALTNFRPHHETSVSGLTANTTYHYKLYTCDPSGNCALSSCKNATTAVKHQNITFKLLIPTGWKVDIPEINLTNFSGTYALKASTKHLDDINITVKKNENQSVKLVGVDIFEKTTINISAFTTGTGLLGMDSNQYQSAKQKLGLDYTEVEIPASGTKADKLEHCDDSGLNCQTVTSSLNCTFTTASTTCKIPDAVGLGHSTYKASVTTTASSSSSSSGGGGGGGGSAAAAGGGAAATTGKVSKIFGEVAAGKAVSMKVNNKDLAVKQIVITIANPVKTFTLSVEKLDSKPTTITKDVAGKVYKYMEINKAGITNADVSSATVQFDVKQEWLTNNSLTTADVRLFRWTGQWDELSTTYVSTVNSSAKFEAVTPGFSTFAVGSSSGAPTTAPATTSAPAETAVAETTEPESPTGSVVEETSPETEQVAEEPEAVEKSGGATTTILIVGLVVVAMLVAGIMMYRKKQQ